MIAVDLNHATRQVFGNITPWMQVIFFAMILVSFGWLGWQLENRRRRWFKGGGRGSSATGESGSSV